MGVADRCNKNDFVVERTDNLWTGGAYYLYENLQQLLGGDSENPKKALRNNNCT